MVDEEDVVAVLVWCTAVMLATVQHWSRRWWPLAGQHQHLLLLNGEWLWTRAGKRLVRWHPKVWVKEGRGKRGRREEECVCVCATWTNPHQKYCQHQTHWHS